MRSLGFRDGHVRTLRGNTARSLGAASLTLSTLLAAGATAGCQSGGEIGTNTIQIFEASPKVATPYFGQISAIAHATVSEGGPVSRSIQVAQIGTHQVVSPDVLQVGEAVHFDCLNPHYADHHGVVQSIADHNTGGYPNPEPAGGGGGAYGTEMVQVAGVCFTKDTLVGNQYLHG
jgi:hypothetical protein